MKKSVILFLLMLLSQVCLAEDELTVFHKDGNKTVFALSTTPVITFSGEDMMVKSNILEITIPIEYVDYYTVNSSETGIENINKSDGFELDNESVNLTGLNPNEVVRVVSLNGIVLQTHLADSQGTAKINLSSLTKGCYIIKSKSNSFKILKK